MGYSTAANVYKLLAQSLTSATPATLNTLGYLINVGKTIDNNLVNLDLVNYYIAESDSFINSTINLLYATPLKKIADDGFILLIDIDEYNNTISVNNAGILNPGDELIIMDSVKQENVIVDYVEDTTIVTTTQIFGNYYYADPTTRVVRVKYPDPIPYVSARRAAANIYDKYFSAQASPNKSNFGVELRALVNEDLNKILAGVTILHGQHRIKNRNYNPNINPAEYGIFPKLPESFKLDEKGAG